MRLHLRTLSIFAFLALLLAACAPVKEVTPTAVYTTGTPGVWPNVEIILPESIPCDKVTDENCKYNFRLKFQETHGAGAIISSICLSYTDRDDKTWTEGGRDGCFDTNLVLAPGGKVEYDRDLWVMGGNFMGGKLNVRVTVKFEGGTTFGGKQSAQLAWPSWPTRTPKLTPSPTGGK